MWKGRFQDETAPATQRYSESVSFDWRLYRHDIRGSIAHATMLAACGVLARDERDAIIRGLRDIEREIAAGRFRWRIELEDVHMNIESELTNRIGPAGAKLHTARSRNDQVATDLRLYLRDEIAAIRAAILDLIEVLSRRADEHAGDLLPGYTHLQRAQPVSLGHHLLAYAEMLGRDDARLADCHDRADVLPLGSGALAGTTLPLDRALTARLLGFAAVARNSMDAVSDRDFVIEFLAAAAIAGLHLSRLCEDLILWATSEFGFCRMADAHCTGSSLMPQKRNPDVAELTRGKTGRLAGNLVSLLVLVKALPLTYNRDLQEDKPPLFDSADTLRSALTLMGEVVGALEFDRERMAAAAADPAMLATDLAEMLVAAGVPFRRAHAVVGGWVALAERRGVLLTHVPEADLRAAAPDETAALAPGFLGLLDAAGSLRRRRAVGGPAPERVGEEAARWREELRARREALAARAAAAAGTLAEVEREVLGDA